MALRSDPEGFHQTDGVEDEEKRRQAEFMNLQGGTEEEQSLNNVGNFALKCVLSLPCSQF